jgi:hypothetical protein
VPEVPNLEGFYDDWMGSLEGFTDAVAENAITDFIGFCPLFWGQIYAGRFSGVPMLFSFCAHWKPSGNFHPCRFDFVFCKGV